MNNVWMLVDDGSIGENWSTGIGTVLFIIQILISISESLITHMTTVVAVKCFVYKVWHMLR